MTTIILILVLIIRAYIPVLRIEKSIKEELLTIKEIIVIFKLYVLLPIASIAKDKGASIYWRIHIGASILI